VVSDRLAVAEDLRRLGVLLLRHVADLLEQRQVDVGLDVACRPRVPVPVPGAAEVAALLDDADVVDAGLAQAGPGEEAPEAAADDQHLDLVGERISFVRGDVGIVGVPLVLAGDLDVLLVAVGTETLVALLAVLLTQCVGVERRRAHATVVAVRTVWVRPRRPVAVGVTVSITVTSRSWRSVRCRRGGRRPRSGRARRGASRSPRT